MENLRLAGFFCPEGTRAISRGYRLHSTPGYKL